MGKKLNGFSVKKPMVKWDNLGKSRFGLKNFMKNKTRNLILTGLLIAATVVLARLLAIQTPIVRISMEFIPIVLVATLFGPVIGGLAAGLADIIGMLVLPAGPYFPGFTISAVVYGVIYGLFLYGKEIRIKNTLICVLFNIIIVDFFLVSVWLHILTQMPYEVLIVSRFIKCIILYPVQVFAIYYGVNAIKKNVRIEDYYE